MRSVYVLEHPLMDYLAVVEQDFPEAIGAHRGGMKLIEASDLEAIMRGAPITSLQPGGSGANTARGLALLLGDEAGSLGRVAYSGAVGADEPGRRFAALLECYGIEASLVSKKSPTGISTLLLTPDHERTMLTYLGASQEFSPEDVDGEILGDSSFIYTTAYLLGDLKGSEVLETIGRSALPGKNRICFDLADSDIVARARDSLSAWIGSHVDVLFGNRDELSAISGSSGSDAEILRAARDLASIVVMKIGRGGCLILEGRRLHHVPGELVVVQDGTGAGDSFAAGFLYGLVKGLDLPSCGRLGNRFASRIIATIGCRLDLMDRQELISVL